MSRGEQPLDDVQQAQEWADRLGVETYACRVCDWVNHYSGMGYDDLLGICSYCALRAANLYNMKHGGWWFSRDHVTETDLAYFGDNPPPAPRTKAKISQAIRMRVYERDGFKCVYCGERKNLSLDHVTPESKGGASEIGNLVTACRPCNTKKKTKSLADFWETRE